ncbi:MAG: hypothetical protein P4M02_08195 [Clostridia bacterium]|nr:hypothetical protein [Clostridia bacterium]
MESLYEKYPPSAPCSCDICKGYCRRPGWWTVDQAQAAIKAGYARRMMLEISPEMDFGVLSPAFKGAEANLALNIFAGGGCTFFKGGLCELHATGHIPLECSFCHHSRAGEGTLCHKDLEEDWKTENGRKLVKRWRNIVNL